MELVKIMTEGTMRAMILHSQDKGIKTNEGHLANARQIIKAEWQELIDTLKDATEAHMGETMYQHIMNTFCNSWAVKAIK